MGREACEGEKARIEVGSGACVCDLNEKSKKFTVWNWIRATHPEVRKKKPVCPYGVKGWSLGRSSEAKMGLSRTVSPTRSRGPSLTELGTAWRERGAVCGGSLRLGGCVVRLGPVGVSKKRGEVRREVN